jgi:alkanesulfonate monooxygenase SsuD/methylene tetrahydromethanopterin reductase-like flavin-dependent oxidoreductase (luciferase family)
LTVIRFDRERDQAGRVTLGLSVGHHPWNDLGHGIPLEAPLGRLRETVNIVRKAAAGGRFTHDGRAFKGINTDTLVSSNVATGTPDQAWSKIQQYFDAGCTRVAIAAFPRGRRHVEATLELMGTTAPSGMDIGVLRAAGP